MRRALALGVAALVPVIGGLLMTSLYYFRSTASEQPQEVMIAPGSSTMAILTQLHEAGVTPPPAWLVAPMALSGLVGTLKAGEYRFEAGSSPASVLYKISRGEVVIHKLTIPEGLTSQAILQLIAREPLLSGENPQTLAEGSLLPDTLHICRGEPRSAVINRMHEALVRYLEKAWPLRDPAVTLASPQQAMILASIVEAETGVADERAQVAAVFYNRLARGMRLQSDPTVSYGITGGAPLARLLMRRDLDTDSPYNTYTRDGLPPGPICHPGRAAIDAVLHPAHSDALYFVATGQGGHRFSATLAAHEEAVTDYKKMMKQRSRH